mmetsp:Transcript_22002/g.38737  ORF Transcript_22002/g.38737 Transcript_22002/m.38737 type:complete len:229 (-) Transcript_22002:174-860(-)
MITNLSMPDFSLNAFSTRSCSSSGAMAMTTSTESGILLIGPELTPDFFLLLPLPFLPPPALKPPPPPKPPFSAIIAFSFSAVASFFVAVGTSAFTVASAASTSHHSFLASTSSGSLGKRTSGLSSVPSNIPTKSRPSSRFDLLTSSALMTLYSSFFFCFVNGFSENAKAESERKLHCNAALSAGKRCLDCLRQSRDHRFPVIRQLHGGHKACTLGSSCMQRTYTWWRA